MQKKLNCMINTLTIKIKRTFILFMFKIPIFYYPIFHFTYLVIVMVSINKA